LRASFEFSVVFRVALSEAKASHYIDHQLSDSLVKKRMPIPNENRSGQDIMRETGAFWRKLLHNPVDVNIIFKGLPKVF
jgi:hypothetical protein